MVTLLCIIGAEGLVYNPRFFLGIRRICYISLFYTIRVVFKPHETFLKTSTLNQRITFSYLLTFYTVENGLTDNEKFLVASL